MFCLVFDVLLTKMTIVMQEASILFKMDDSHFKVVRQIATYSEDEIYLVKTAQA